MTTLLGIQDGTSRKVTRKPIFHNIVRVLLAGQVGFLMSGDHNIKDIITAARCSFTDAA